MVNIYKLQIFFDLLAGYRLFFYAYIFKIWYKKNIFFLNVFKNLLNPLYGYSDIDKHEYKIKSDIFLALNI